MDEDRVYRAARKVVARRGELDMTQDELAKRAGIDPTTVRNLERREGPRWPIARTRARIEKALLWPNGEIERLALEDEQEPGIPAALEEAVKRSVPETDAPRVIEAVRRALADGA